MKAKRDSGSGLVYSTEHGRLCPGCEKPVGRCVCAKQKQGAPAGKADGVVRVMRETKGRKGSGVTLVTGLSPESTDLAGLAKRLKQLCGSGGTVKNGVIEIQGDHRDQIMAALLDLGHNPKKAGG